MTFFIKITSKEIKFLNFKVSYAVSCIPTRDNSPIAIVDDETVSCTFIDTTNNTKDVVLLTGGTILTSPRRYKEGAVMIVQLERTYIDTPNAQATVVEQARKSVTIEKADVTVALNIIP